VDLSAVQTRLERLRRRLVDVSERGDRAFWIGLAVMVLSVVSALISYLILTGLTPIAPRSELVLPFYFLNGLLILAMVGVLAWQAAGLWRAWKAKAAGARLHIRIVALFSLIAAVPAILLAIAATTTFARSLDNWFSTRTRQIIANSLEVANAYLEEHGQLIRTDVVNMAKDIDDAAPVIAGDTVALRRLVIAQAGLRDLPVAYIVDGNGVAAVRFSENEKLAYEPPPRGLMQAADAGQVPLLMPSDNFRVAAMARLEKFPDRYLYVMRGVNPKVMGQLRRAQDGVAEYEQLRQVRGNLKIVHGLMYFMISLTALLAAIWVGIWFASRFVAPISRLIGAAQQVSRGDLDVALPVRRGEGDLRRLSETFNTMTSELKSQRNALVTANAELTERSNFIETVLSSVTAGILDVDAAGRITLVNRSAEALLATTADALVGRTLADALPAFAEALAQQSGEDLKPRAQIEAKMAIDGDERSFAIRATRRSGTTPNAAGTVVTFDDITELVSAQRTSAWGEVARRMAHEIKNPLTPIILSAERIRRKYGRIITEDRDTFDKLTATIERQAGDIKSMVDEFAAFARIPKPVMETSDLRDALQDAVILFREGHPGVTFVLDVPKEPVLASIDRRMIGQAATNLVKNATEAVESVAAGAEADWRGRVEVSLKVSPERCDIEVIDNGPGLPKQNRSRLLEPYVTTKGNKGTGLGLAIVQKIVEQHGGVLMLEDAPVAPGRTRGALVRISLPASIAASGTEPASDEKAPVPRDARLSATGT
jgi:two-component system nitrogen regulation sensor histidine kinase NtrY